MSELTLEQQVARLTAIEDIKQMKARYCGYADDGYDPEGLASLFVEAEVFVGVIIILILIFRQSGITGNAEIYWPFKPDISASAAMKRQS